jgi:hypothetical protein
MTQEEGLRIFICHKFMVDKADMVDVFRNIFLLVIASLIYLVVPADTTAAVPSLLQPRE